MAMLGTAAGSVRSGPATVRRRQSGAAHLASDGVVQSLGRSEYKSPSGVIAEGVPERHGLCPTSGLSPRAAPWSERSVRGNHSSPRADALDKPFGTADNDEQRWEGNAGKKTVYAARQQKTAGSAPGFAEKVKGGKIHKDQPSTAGDTGRRRGRAATPTRMDRSTTDVILPDPVDDPRRGLRLYLSPKVAPHDVHLNAPFGNDRNAPQRRREHRKAHHTAPFAADANKGAEDPIFTGGPLSSGSEHKPTALTPKARRRNRRRRKNPKKKPLSGSATVAAFMQQNSPPRGKKASVVENAGLGLGRDWRGGGPTPAQARGFGTSSGPGGQSGSTSGGLEEISLGRLSCDHTVSRKGGSNGQQFGNGRHCTEGLDAAGAGVGGGSKVVFTM